MCIKQCMDNRSVDAKQIMRKTLIGIGHSVSDQLSRINEVKVKFDHITIRGLELQ